MAQDDPYSAYAVAVSPRKPSIKERQTEAQIGSSEASAASSAASAARTTAMTPVDIASTTARTATEEQTRPATVRKGAAEADIAEMKAEQLRLALDKARRQASGRPQGAALKEAEDQLLVVLRNAAAAKRMSEEDFGATGFGSSLMQKVGGTPATTVSGLLEQIGSNTAFDKLQKIREASPTGGALGAVSDTELGLLKSSLGASKQDMSDEEFQRGMDDVIRNYLNVYSKIGGDPYKLPEVLGPANIEKFSDVITAWRPLPEDEEAITRYVNEARDSGTFTPSDYAAYMAQAYKRATGREVDEAFLENAVDEGMQLQGVQGPVAGFSYEDTDRQTRQDILERAAAASPEDTGWSSTLGGAAMNLPESTVDLAVDTVKALTVNLPDTLEGVAAVVGGATGLSKNDEAWEAVKDYYGDRYGSMEGFKYALKTDPASVLADIAGVASGGATLTAKGLQTAGRVSNIASLSAAARGVDRLAAAAARIDPLTRGLQVGANAAKATGRTAAAIAANVPAKLAGVTGQEVRQAVAAGKRGSPEFLAQLTQTGDVTDPLAKMDGAISELYQSRSADYARRMAKMNKTETLGFDDVDTAIENARSVGRHRGIDISAAAGAWDDIDQLVGQFREQGLSTIEDFDAMKRAVGNIRDKFQRGTPEYKVGQDVYRAINDTIVEKAPVYANIMKDYREASDALSDIQASLSSNSASADTILSRLRKTATGRGPRGTTVLDVLEQTKSGRGIGDSIAGAAMSGTEPSGLATSLTPIAAASTQSPEMLAAMALTPRFVGQQAYNIGQKLGAAERAVEGVRGLAPVAAAETKLADLSGKYGADASRILRSLNPAVIQPLVDPMAMPPEIANQQDASYNAALLASQPAIGLPAISARPAPTAGSLDALSAQYAAEPTPASATPDLSALSAKYTGAATTPTITVGNRRVQFDETTDTYVDLDTGERVRDVTDFEVKMKTGGRVFVPRAKFRDGGRVYKGFARALKG